MANSTRQKPEKPRPDYPLYAHPSGQWCKKIKGRAVYFGVWEDPEEAERLWLHEKPYLEAGKQPPPLDEPVVDELHPCTIKTLKNKFLMAKEEAVKADELSIDTFKDYLKTCRDIEKFFGGWRRVDDLKLDDFGAYRAELAKRLNANSLGNEINRVKIVFRWAKKNRLIKEEVEFGDQFKKPPARKVRAERRKGGKRLFTRDELLRILAESGPKMRAMVLLGVNGGLGNSDVARLQWSNVDLKTGWLDYPRPKTEVERLVPLWPETVEALKALERKGELVFYTWRGNAYVRNDTPLGTGPEKSVRKDSVTQEFAKILRRLGINGRKNLGFYSLRHTFETIAQRAGNQVAVDQIMGHCDNSMAGRYREQVSQPHLRQMAEVVRQWLFEDKEINQDAS